jgi:hypothetical protein
MNYNVLSCTVIGCTSERTFGVASQLRRRQTIWNGRKIHCDKRIIAALTQTMDKASNDILSDSGFTEKKNRKISASGKLNLRAQALDRMANSRKFIVQ